MSDQNSTKPTKRRIKQIKWTARELVCLTAVVQHIKASPPHLPYLYTLAYIKRVLTKFDKGLQALRKASMYEDL